MAALVLVFSRLVSTVNILFMIDTFLMDYIVIARIYGNFCIMQKNSENLIKLGAKELYSFQLCLLHFMSFLFFF